MTDLRTARTLDLREKTITTFIMYEVHQALAGMAEGERLEVTTDRFAAIETDVESWCRTTGNELVAKSTNLEPWQFTIEKGPPHPSGHRFAAVISDDGLFELLSPLGFALAAGLEGHDVSLYFQGPAVRVLAGGFVARMHGPAKVFSRWPRKGLAAAGHLPPQEKIAQIQKLGGRLYICGAAMDHYKVDADDIVFEDVTIAEYLTFMEQMDQATMQLYV